MKGIYMILYPPKINIILKKNSNKFIALGNQKGIEINK